jgi:hypothetical protein
MLCNALALLARTTLARSGNTKHIAVDLEVETHSNAIVCLNYYRRFAAIQQEPSHACHE